MITAVDTNILLDIFLQNDRGFFSNYFPELLSPTAS